MTDTRDTTGEALRTARRVFIAAADDVERIEQYTARNKAAMLLAAVATYDAAWSAFKEAETAWEAAWSDYATARATT